MRTKFLPAFVPRLGTVGGDRFVATTNATSPSRAGSAIEDRDADQDGDAHRDMRVACWRAASAPPPSATDATGTIVGNEAVLTVVAF